MRMRKDHRVNLGGINRKPVPVAQAQLFEPLEQSAIDENFLTRRFDQIFRSGDRSNAAKKLRCVMMPSLLFCTLAIRAAKIN